MTTIFTKIINGEIPSYKVAETDKYYAFLDISPLAKGHTLVIPKNETDYVFDLEDDELAGLMVFAKRVARAIDKTVTCKRVGVVVMGLEVAHVHIHLIPMNSGLELNFSNPKLSLPTDEMQEIAEQIASNL